MDIDPGMGEEMDCFPSSLTAICSYWQTLPSEQLLAVSIEFLEADCLTSKSELCVRIQREEQSRALVLSEQ